jgi:D-alanyl-D-alanine carboxypeptidase
MKRLLASIAISLLIAGCGGNIAPETPDDRPPGAAPPIELPAPTEAVPAYLLYSEESFDKEAVRDAERAPELAVAATASVQQRTVSSGTVSGTVRVGAVDPLEFRSVAPAASRDATFVWAEMEAGEAIVTFAGADALDLGEQTTVQVGNTSLSVGAYADNGVPNIADVMVNDALGEELDLGPPQWLVVGAEPGADLTRLAATLERLFPDARIAQLLANSPDIFGAKAPQAVGEATGSLIGTMSFRILDNGFIKPDPEWVNQNIAKSEVPIIGEVTCHRLLIPQLGAALNEIIERELADQIRADDYGGCYVPRFIDRDPSLPLSMHAFGLAVDINVSTNLLGSRGDQDPRVVAIFEKWGFEWGGRWDRPDPMHFELARIVES